jgi:hypothetical protein
MLNQNKGYDPATIEEYRRKMEARNKNFLMIESEDNSDEYVNFFFIGKYEGKEVIYDAVIYTLRLHYQSELYEIAEHKAAKRFPNFKSVHYEEDENGDLKAPNSEQEEIGLYMAEIMMELEEEEAVKVQEHVETDPNLDFGVGLDVALNVNAIDEKVISRFVKQYNEGTLSLDDTMYSFVEEEDSEVEG